MEHASILIADADPVTCNLFRGFLDGLPCEIITVRDGQTVLDVLQSTLPILAIVDVFMPFMSGGEILRRIRADERLSSVKVFLMFFAMEDVDGKDIEGADGIISKLTTRDNLVQVVEAVLYA